MSKSLFLLNKSFRNLFAEAQIDTPFRRLYEALVNILSKSKIK
jgi:hypothetical protein